MKFPMVIRFFSEKIEKPVSEFTKKDWQQVAMIAGDLIDREYEKANPLPKKKGRPRKPISLVRLLELYKPKARPGRGMALYCGHSAAEILRYMALVSTKEMRSKFPNSGFKLRDNLRIVLSVICKGQTETPDLLTIERAIRRERTRQSRAEKADKIRK